MNINATNIAMVAGGGIMYMLGKKSLLFGKIGPIIAVGLGLADMTGIMPLDKITNQIKSMIPGAGSNYAGAYAVDLRNLPYDANNYYLPPRDTSILP